MIDTKAYHYNQAVKELAQTPQRTDGELLNLIGRTGTAKLHDYPEHRVWLTGFSCTAIFLINEMEASGKTAYNADIEMKLINRLGLEGKTLSEGQKDVIGECVYNSQVVNRANKTMAHYETMKAQGFTPFHDITEAEHGKKALVTGKLENDLLTFNHNDMSVRLVCYPNNGGIGYARPRMRTRYIPVGVSDLFFKIIK